MRDSIKLSYPSLGGAGIHTLSITADGGRQPVMAMVDIVNLSRNTCRINVLKI